MDAQGYPDKPLGLGEYNGHTAAAIKAAGDAILSTPEVWFGLAWNSDTDTYSPLDRRPDHRLQEDQGRRPRQEGLLTLGACSLPSGPPLPIPRAAEGVLPRHPTTDNRLFAPGLTMRHPRGDLGARVESQLPQDVLHVSLRGAHRDVQPFRDLRVREPAGDEIGDLGLAAGQGRLRRCRLPRRAPGRRRARTRSPGLRRAPNPAGTRSGTRACRAGGGSAGCRRTSSSRSRKRSGSRACRSHPRPTERRPATGPPGGRSPARPPRARASRARPRSPSGPRARS